MQRWIPQAAFILLPLALIIPLGWASTGPFPGMSLPAAINYTSSFISAVNGSGYLIFQPNLTLAYSYLEKAKNVSSGDPAAAYAYLNKALEAARMQQGAMARYKGDAFTILLVLMVISAFFLYWFSKPVSRPPRKKSRR